jgi:hypothetical protein
MVLAWLAHPPQKPWAVELRRGISFQWFPPSRPTARYDVLLELQQVFGPREESEIWVTFKKLKSYIYIFISYIYMYMSYIRTQLGLPWFIVFYHMKIRDSATSWWIQHPRVTEMHCRKDQVEMIWDHHLDPQDCFGLMSFRFSLVRWVYHGLCRK